MRLKKRSWSGLVLTVLVCFLMTACGGAEKEPDGGFDVKKAEAAAMAAQSGGSNILENPVRPADQELMDVYGIDVSLLEESLLLIDENYSLCLALKPAGGKENDVKNMMAASLESLATQLELYAPEQSSKIKGCLESIRGDYLLYIACADNNAMADAIDAAME